MTRRQLLRALLVVGLTLLAWQVARPPGDRPGPDASGSSAGLTWSEQAFAGTLRGGPWDEVLMSRAASDFERRAAEGSSLSYHYTVYARWARQRLGQDTGTPLSTYDQAMLDYLGSRPDPAEALLEIAATRADHAGGPTAQELYMQWSQGFFSSTRAASLVERVRAHLETRRLQGATVADIGSGPGHFSRALLDLVGPGGRVLALDIDPSVARVQPWIARLDPVFSRIEFRVIRNEPGVSGLRPTDRVDVAFLMDVHILGGRTLAPPADQQVRWLDSLYRGLRPGGSLFVFESHGGRRELDQTVQILARSAFGHHVRAATGPGPQSTRQDSSFIAVATRVRQSAPKPGPGRPPAPEG